MSPPAGCASLRWDSDFFGLNIGRISGTCRDAASLREAAAWGRTDGLDCVYALLDGSEPLLARHAAELGFNAFGSRITLRASIQPVKPASRPIIREATAADLPTLRVIASQSHRASRFYADPGFPLHRCDALYAEWIERSVHGQMAEAVLVAAEGAAPLGYITCSVDTQGVGQIGLFAVAGEARGQGYGSKLIEAALAWFAERGLGNASVVTQGHNVAALGVYSRRGFVIQQIELWHHAWPKLR